MSLSSTTRVGYVMKQYPRFSETFIVNEILAHEAAGLSVEIFSLRPPTDAHFQDTIARVQAPVTYIPAYGLKIDDFWGALCQARTEFPDLCRGLEAARGEAPRDVCQALILASCLRKRGITHLHAHFASVATTVARLASAFTGVPYSFTAHAKDIFHESVRGEDLCRKLAEAASVVTVSDHNLHYLRDRFGSAAGRVRRIYNGLDLAHFPYEEPRERPRTIVSVGRLVEKKGLDVLISACRILVDRGLEFDCKIVGVGEEEEALRSQIGDLRLAERVEMIGARPQADVIRIVQNAAVFAAPCVVGEDGNRDGLPTVLLEAMALGTPCVSTDVTGIPEVLRDDETGLMVLQRDAEALASAMERLLDDGGLRTRLAANARRMIEDDFDSEKNTAGLRELFHAANKDMKEAA
jgi:colanic acid/amylovoran biosynthesis glycosyltransferase